MSIAATSTSDAADAAPVPTELYRDASRTVLAENDSPDIGFRFSLNPYRGCEHGCIYCYARPSHEYLGFSAGLDFERKLMVKTDAPALLRAALASPRWQPQVIALSGNTDCYQPVERRLRLTRACLEVFAEFRNPVSVITKSALVTRDADLLAALAAARRGARVSVDHLARCRPGAAHGAARRDAGAPPRGDRARWRAPGVPVGVMIGAGHPRPERPRDSRRSSSAPRRPARAAPAGSCCAWRSPLDQLFADWLENATSPTAPAASSAASASAAPAS